MSTRSQLKQTKDTPLEGQITGWCYLFFPLLHSRNHKIDSVWAHTWMRLHACVCVHAVFWSRCRDSATHTIGQSYSLSEDRIWELSVMHANVKNVGCSNFPTTCFFAYPLVWRRVPPVSGVPPWPPSVRSPGSGCPAPAECTWTGTRPVHAPSVSSPPGSDGNLCPAHGPGVNRKHC